MSAEAVQADLQQLRQLHVQHDRLTLLTAAKVIEHSHLPVLQSVLQDEIE
ncbi:DUF488 family protein, N3 subclade [Testudinibacter sp. TR-2022]